MFLRRPLCVLLAASLMLCGSACSNDSTDESSTTANTITVTDGAGREVTLEVPVQKVAVFNGATAELIRAVGAGETIVGLDSGSMDESMTGYWPGFDESMSVGAGQSEPNYDKIAKLDPDVVLFPSNSAWEEAVTKLEPFDIKVLVVTGWDLPPLFDNIELLGTIFGTPDEADAFAQFCQDQQDLLDERLAGVEKPTVYIENQGDYMTVVEGAGWDAMVAGGGGQNIFTSLEEADENATNVNGVEVAPEAVLAKSPNYVIRIVTGGFVGTGDGALDATLSALVERPGWQELPAVTDGGVIVTENRWLNGCSKILGSVAVATWLHPDLFADVDPLDLERQYLEEFQGIEPADITQFVRSPAA